MKMISAKIHKLSNDDYVEKFPIRPIISNIDTTTHHLAKYLSKLISHLSISEYTVSSTIYLTQNIGTTKVPIKVPIEEFMIMENFQRVLKDHKGKKC